MKRRIRNLIAFIVSNLLIASGLIAYAKRRLKHSEVILSIYFHAPSEKLFKFCVIWLNKNKFTFLSQQDVLLIARGDRPFPKRAVLITIDDGWQSNEKNIVSIADLYRIPVTIFISTEPVQKGTFWWPYIKVANEIKLMDWSIDSLKKVPNDERRQILDELKIKIILPRHAMTVDQVINIAKSEYIVIGSHSVTHPILTNCTSREVNYELRESKKLIEGWINEQIISFAYPNGDYGEREISVLKSLGYSLAFTTNPECLTKNHLLNLYELPRFCVYDDISKSEAICRILGVWQKIFKR